MKELAKTNKENMTITLYPDFMGYKENGYEVDVEMQGHTAWVNHLMKKFGTKIITNFKTHLIKTGEN